MRGGRGKGVSTPVRRREVDGVDPTMRYRAYSLVVVAGQARKSRRPFRGGGRFV